MIKFSVGGGETRKTLRNIMIIKAFTPRNSTKSTFPDQNVIVMVFAINKLCVRQKK